MKSRKSRSFYIDPELKLRLKKRKNESMGQSRGGQVQHESYTNIDNVGVHQSDRLLPAGVRFIYRVV